MKVNILNVCILMIGLFFVTSCSTDLIEGAKKEGDEVLTENNVSLLVSNTECLEIQFPITLKYPDESTVSVSSSEELKSTLKAWFQTKPPKGQRVNIVFPIDVNFKGESKTVESQKELRGYMKECFDGKVGKGKKTPSR